MAQAWLPHGGRDGRPRRHARRGARRRSLEGQGLDFSAILYNPPVPSRVARRCVQAQDHGLDQALDHQLIASSCTRRSLETLSPVEVNLPVRNVHRTVGAMLERRDRAPLRLGRTARRHHPHPFHGLGGPELRRIPRQRCHARRSKATANDYVGKGLSGGRIIVYPPRDFQLPAGRKHPRRQRCSLWRDQRRSLLQRRRRRALRRSQLRRNRGGRRRWRSRLRIHDQWHWSWCSAPAAETSPPA